MTSVSRHHFDDAISTHMFTHTPSRMALIAALAAACRCATNDPNLLTTLGLQGGDVPGYPGPMWEMGLDSLRTTYGCTGAFSTYYIGTENPDAGDMNGTIDTLHMHIFRDRFYSELAGNKTIAAWAQDLLNDQVEDLGP